MSLTKLTCPSCAAVLQLAKAVSPTSRLKCPRCATVFSPPADVPIEITPIAVPDLPIAVPEDLRPSQQRPAEPETQYEDAADDYERRPRRRKFRKRKQSQGAPIGLAIGLVIGAFGILAVAFAVAFVLWPTGDKFGPPSTGVVRGPGPSDPPLDNRPGARSGREWKPDAAYVGRLAPYVSVGDAYEVRPPIGYANVKMSFEEQGFKGNFVAFHGEQRPDGSLSRMLIMAGPDVSGEPLEKFMIDFLAGFKNSQMRSFSQMTQSTPEHGRIGGIACVRAEINAKTVSGQPARGVAYVAQDGRDVVALLTLDLIPPYEDDQRLVESSMLSIRKRK